MAPNPHIHSARKSSLGIQASVQDRVPPRIGNFKIESEVSGEFELL